MTYIIITSIKNNVGIAIIQNVVYSKRISISITEVFIGSSFTPLLGICSLRNT